MGDSSEFEYRLVAACTVPEAVAGDFKRALERFGQLRLECARKARRAREKRVGPGERRTQTAREPPERAVDKPVGKR
jgi:hypothetical protein